MSTGSTIAKAFLFVFGGALLIGGTCFAFVGFSLGLIPLGIVAVAVAGFGIVVIIKTVNSQ